MQNDLEIIKRTCVDVEFVLRADMKDIVEAAKRMADRIAKLERASSHWYEENQDGLKEIDRLQNKIEKASCETCKSFQEATAAEIVEGNYWCDCSKMYWGTSDHFHKEKMKCDEWEAE